jgi:hypothetical protein
MRESEIKKQREAMFAAERQRIQLGRNPIDIRAIVKAILSHEEREIILQSLTFAFENDMPLRPTPHIACEEQERKFMQMLLLFRNTLP